MKSTVCVLLFILILLKVLCCQGCWKLERKALMSVNAQLGSPFHWVDGTDCCKWERVECNITTGRVTTLNLSGAWDNQEDWYLNYSDFRVFEDLKSLNLSENRITGCVENKGLRLSNPEVLDLSINFLDNITCVIGFPSLKSLYLGDNRIKASHDLFSNMRNLEILDMSNNFNDIDIASTLSGLSSLKSLNLEANQLTSQSILGILKLKTLEILDLAHNKLNNSILWSLDWSGFKALKELDISSNEFVGPLPSFFGNLSSLQRLKLSYNNFTGDIGSNLASLTSLEYIDFEGNEFEVPISFIPFVNHSNLKFVYGDKNKIMLDSNSALETWIPKFQLQELSLSSMTLTNSLSLPIPNFLLYQYNLSILDFTGCRLEGEFPNWLLKNNTKMTHLAFSGCSFVNTFQLPLHPFLSLVEIDLSDNSITGHIPNNISSIFPNLRYLDMSMNAIYGSIPREFGRWNMLETLDLSNNHLFGEIPKNMSQLKYFRLSNNKLVGSLFPTLSNMKQLKYLFLDGNSFSGNFPSSFFNTSFTVLDISNNLLVGKLPSGLGNNSCVELLSMSNNKFEGSIPIELVEQYCLKYLDISHNELTNSIPSFVNSSVRSIHLSNNRLSGLAKRMFNSRNPTSSLATLDLRYNEISSSHHNLIQDLRDTYLNFLLLQGNRFTGHIPEHLCDLRQLKILDLSYNKFNGPIPSCLGEIPFGRPEIVDIRKTSIRDSPMWDAYLFKPEMFKNAKAEFTTKRRSYTYTGKVLSSMTGIDLSSNRLDGNIPPELGKLAQIHALNLSHNYLRGKIPATFSNLEQIESLDLSFNNLSGNIPSQLSELTFLAVFSVAHNNLSGAIPDRKGQFMTFDESCYKDNPFLCGPPLPKGCIDFTGQPPASLPNGSGTNKHNSLVDMYTFCVSFAVAYTMVSLTIIATLFINPYWRRAWFYYLELVVTNCYYFIEDNLLFKYCKYAA